MKVSSVRVRKIDSDGKLKAYVTVTLDECFVIHNVKIIEGKNGIFIAMPSRKTKGGDYKDIAHPICSDFRNELQNAILDAYNNCTETMSESEAEAADSDF